MCLNWWIKKLITFYAQKFAYLDIVSPVWTYDFYKVLWSGLQIRVHNQKLFFLISQAKHVLWELKRTVWMRQFF